MAAMSARLDELLKKACHPLLSPPPPLSPVTATPDCKTRARAAAVRVVSRHKPSLFFFRAHVWAVEQASAPLSFVVYVPQWTDCEALETMQRSPYLRQHRALPPRSHTYVVGSQVASARMWPAAALLAFGKGLGSPISTYRCLGRHSSRLLPSPPLSFSALLPSSISLALRVPTPLSRRPMVRPFLCSRTRQPGRRTRAACMTWTPSLRSVSPRANVWNQSHAPR